MRLRPTAGKVFIKPDWDEIKSSNIIIPGVAKKRDIPTQGVVWAMGGVEVTKKGVKIPIEFKIGDRVLIEKHTGLMEEIDGQTLVRITIRDVLAVL